MPSAEADSGRASQGGRFPRVETLGYLMTSLRDSGGIAVAGGRVPSIPLRFMLGCHCTPCGLRRVARKVKGDWEGEEFHSIQLKDWVEQPSEEGKSPCRG